MDHAGLRYAQDFNQEVDGKPVSLYSISAADGGRSCHITNYGARVVSLMVPDRNGTLTDVVLGYRSLEEYCHSPDEYIGAIVGRCANRIAAGLFVLDGVTHVLHTNDNHNTLNSGAHGFHSRVWDVRKRTANMLVLNHTDKENKEGFPGNVDVELIYEWTDATTLKISLHATTDKATLVNLSNNIYFNLNGEGSPNVLNHELYINADAITAVDYRNIPNGLLDPVHNTLFDFTTPKPISSNIAGRNPEIDHTQGYNHHFVLHRSNPAAEVRSPDSGIKLTINTNQPAMQLYSGGLLDGSRMGKSGLPYQKGSTLMLAPQGFPDAIHHPQFPSIVLRPGEVYYSSSEYQFTT